MALLVDTLTNHALRDPDHCAVVFRDQKLTYLELEQKANQLAHVLRAHGVRPGDRVCLALPKSPRALVAALGIIKAGAICVPLDLLSPAGRVAKVVHVCTPRLVLAGTATVELVRTLRESSAQPELAIGWLDDDVSAPAIDARFTSDALASSPTSRLDSGVDGSAPAYVLFTSGTTGVPKGVMMTHDSIFRFNEWAVRYFGMTPSDHVSGNFAFNFDPSLFDIYATLLAGATLYQIPPELHLLPRALADLIRQSELTIWWSVPAVLAYLAKFEAVRQDDFPTLTRVLWSGEVCPTPVVRYWMQRMPHATFTNLYGPTETAIASTYHTLPAIPASNADDVPIGVACPGEEVAVLDDTLAPLPDGTVGELHIAGVGLSPGYWGNADETERAFVLRGNQRWYKTGDLARIGSDGLVYFLGRRDSQIKVRGYRIELGEIETAAYGTELLREACVVAIKSGHGTLICCAYATGEEHTVGADVVRSALAKQLPPYMLPARWLAYAQLPRNGNGKLDRPQVVRDFESHEAAAESVPA
jgi:amino acid adenylation domain-containing protein